MRTELSVHVGAQPRCPNVAASFGPTQYEQDGEGSWTDHVPTASSAAAAASVSPFPGGLEGGFSRAWLVLCPWGEGYPVFSHFTHNWKAGKRFQASVGIKGAALVLQDLTLQFHDPREGVSHYRLPCMLTLQTGDYIYICTCVCL